MASKPAKTSKRRGSALAEVGPVVGEGKKKVRSSSDPAGSPVHRGEAVSADISELLLVSASGGVGGSRTTAKFPDGSRGFIWQHGLPEDYPDSVGMYLPGHDKICGAKERPERLGAYSRELFRVVELPFLRKRVEEDPLGAVDSVMGHLLEFGSIMGHLRDDLASRAGKLKIWDVGANKIKELVVSRNYHQKRVAEYKVYLDQFKGQLSAAKAALEVREKELDERTDLLKETDAELTRLHRKNGELGTEVETLRSMRTNYDRLMMENA